MDQSPKKNLKISSAECPPFLYNNDYSFLEDFKIPCSHQFCISEYHSMDVVIISALDGLLEKLLR